MYVLAIDQGTTGTTTILYDKHGRIVARAYRELAQIYPKPGWVEHDPMAIWRTVLETVQEVCNHHGGEIDAVGITNQRETTIVWDKTTGTPIYNAVVWQCRRSADFCQKLQKHDQLFRGRTGLPVDPYFSGSKIRWIMDHARRWRVEDTLFGTVDSWLVWKLTGGAVHATDYTNASRTLLFDIHKHCWDKELCDLLGVPMAVLPDARGSMADFGRIQTIPSLKGVPILGVAGDQQAALFGQACFEHGQMKNTYGTGCFVVMNTGQQAVISEQGLLTTLAVSGTGESCYALEGSIFVAGAAVQWLRDELGIITSAAETEYLAGQVSDNGGVYLVPAFVGLGAPHWNMHARGVLVGLTRGSNRYHIVRAALESMAYQTADVLHMMECESGMRAHTLAVDGGACANDFLMQFQSDLIGRPVLRPEVIESTSLGAAYLAGMHSGIWRSPAELVKHKVIEKTFNPAMDPDQRSHLTEGWRRAVQQCLVG